MRRKAMRRTELWRHVMRYSLLVTIVWFCLCLRATVPAEATAEITLTLQQALDMTLANHPTLRSEQATVEAAQQRVYQQVAASLPRGTYTYMYSRQERPLTAAVGGVQFGSEPRERTFSQTFNFHSTNLSISQVLFDFGRTFDLIRSVMASQQASAANFETARQTVILNTKQAY